MTLPSLTKWIGAALLVLAVGITLAAAWHEGDLAVDDAWITFRYAENLREGHGLRWNPDSPPCEGYSNLSYVVAIAALGSCGLPPRVAALLLAAVGVAGIAILLWRATRGAGPFVPLALVPACFLFGAHDLVVHASRGLETVLFAFLACCQVATVARIAGAAPVLPRHGVLAADAGCLLFWTRPDGVLLSATCWCGLWWLVRREPARRRVLLVAIATWLAIGGVYAVAKLAYFGYLLPNPFYMKADVQGFAGVAETAAFVSAYAGTLVLSLLAAAASPWWLRPWRAGSPPRDATAFVAVAVALPWLAYGSKIVHEMGFSHRFAWPLVPVLTLGATHGLAAAGARLATAYGVTARVLAWAALAAAIAAHAPVWQRQWQALAQPRPQEPFTSAFLRLGEAIRSTGIAPELTLYCANAGATPYAAKAHHVDPAGLVDDGYCLRTPLAERVRYQSSLKFDLVAWTLFPASPLAASFDDDARASKSTYLRRVCLDDDPHIGASARHWLGRQSLAQRKLDLFAQMFMLREHATLIGEARIGVQQSRLFVYVWKTSRHHDRLVAHLAPRMDIPVSAIDYDGWPR